MDIRLIFVLALAFAIPIFYGIISGFGGGVSYAEIEDGDQIEFADTDDLEVVETFEDRNISTSTPKVVGLMPEEQSGVLYVGGGYNEDGVTRLISKVKKVDMETNDVEALVSLSEAKTQNDFTIHNDSVYIASRRRIYKLQDDKHVWGGEVITGTSPHDKDVEQVIEFDGDIYSGGIQGEIYRLDSDTGEELGNTDLQGRIEALKSDEDYLYAATKEGKVVRLTKELEKDWGVQIDADKAYDLSLGDESVYVSTDKGAEKFTKDGKQNWIYIDDRMRIDSQYSTEPNFEAISKSKYVYLSRNQLYVSKQGIILLNPETGERVEDIETERDEIMEITSSNGMIYIAMENLVKKIKEI